MMNKYKLIGKFYKVIFKPIAFSLDAEFVHDSISKTGEFLENFPWLVGLLKYENKKLEKEVYGIKFNNPIGLSAGFDYDGHMAQVLKNVGFGFNTVGTVTAKYYEGNKKPRLARLPKSKSLLVNKGFKSGGAIEVAKRLDRKILKGRVIGISVGSSNIPEINTIKKAIEDYLFTLNIFKNKKYVSYFEINISCPNTSMTESFTEPKNFELLLNAIKKLKINKPFFIKMPNEINFQKSDRLVNIAIKNNVKGFIFSNLVKDRNNPSLYRDEVNKVKNLRGNFSGKPTFENSNKLIKHTRQKFGKDIFIIGTGGVFNAKDAKAKFDAGADLVQLITGMIFEGPQLIGEINKDLAN
jgi:dihydroorotate dehydrogenase